MATQERLTVAPQPPLKTFDRRWLLAAGAAYLLLLVVFYPILYTSIDEASAFGMAYVLRHGTIFPAHTPAFHDAQFFPSLSPLGVHGRIYRFPIGFPLLLSVLSFVGWRAFFLVNPLLHLVASACFAWILKANRVPPRYAILYLFFPCFALFTRTLFSDAFAASLTTIALYFLLCRRRPFPAGLCLGLALLARSTSLIVALVLLAVLLIEGWKSRALVPLWKGKAAQLVLGLMPFLIVNWVYSFYAFGSPFRSAYSANALTWHGLAESGPSYAAALLLIYPGMLLAPFLYRGVFWREGLVATTLVTLIAASYNESTFGNSALQTLLSTPRQVLPVMPFYLLAFCGVLSSVVRAKNLVLPKLEAAIGIGLLVVAALISFQHQKYLKTLQAIRIEIQQTLPPRSIVYANKDVYKLYQPVWNPHLTRELPDIDTTQCRADLQKGPVYVVLYSRSRGFAGEDMVNAGIINGVQSRFRLASTLSTPESQVQYYRILGLKNSR